MKQIYKNAYDNTRYDTKLIHDLLADYKPNEDMFCEDSDVTFRIKQNIYTYLSETERRILLLYVHFESVNKTAEVLNVTPALIYKYIARAKNKIKSHL